MADALLEPLTFERANAVQKALRRVAASGPGSWLFARVLHRIDRPVYRLTRGRHTFANLLSGIPVVLLTTTGARSGRPRTIPVLGLPTADGLAVIASNFGQQHQPGWYYNLRADPHGSAGRQGAAARRRRPSSIEAQGIAPPESLCSRSSRSTARSRPTRRSACATRWPAAGRRSSATRRRPSSG